MLSAGLDFYGQREQGQTFPSCWIKEMSFYPQSSVLMVQRPSCPTPRKNWKGVSCVLEKEKRKYTRTHVGKSSVSGGWCERERGEIDARCYPRTDSTVLTPGPLSTSKRTLNLIGFSYCLNEFHSFGRS